MEDQIWQIRHFVYQHFGETARAPSTVETAAHFGLTHGQTVAAYEELHQRHALYLKPGTREILMANPFSGVETEFRVHAIDKTYFANCAWDTLGIPAALHTDAEIETLCAQSGEPVRVSVNNEQVQDAEALVHFLIPFREWYDDLAFT